MLAFREPREAGLPVPTVNSSYIFAREDHFLCYPNNFNYYANYYRNTFQHGGVSMGEMIVAVIKMVNKSNIGEVTIEQKDFKVTVKQKEDHITQVVSSAPVMAAPAPVAAAPSAPASWRMSGCIMVSCRSKVRKCRRASAIS